MKRCGCCGEPGGRGAGRADASDPLPSFRRLPPAYRKTSGGEGGGGLAVHRPERSPCDQPLSPQGRAAAVPPRSVAGRPVAPDGSRWDSQRPSSPIRGSGRAAEASLEGPAGLQARRKIAALPPPGQALQPLKPDLHPRPTPPATEREALGLSSPSAGCRAPPARSAPPLALARFSLRNNGPSSRPHHFTSPQEETRPRCNAESSGSQAGRGTCPRARLQARGAWGGRHSTIVPTGGDPLPQTWARPRKRSGGCSGA